MRFYVLEKLINLHDGYRRQFRINDHDLLLIQQSAELFLVEGHCPHNSHSLLEARVEEESIRCPSHGYCFNLRSGLLLQSPANPCRDLKVYPVSYEGRDVGVVL